jgi:hypothetical protein
LDRSGDSPFRKLTLPAQLEWIRAARSTQPLGDLITMPNGHDKNRVRVCAAVDGFRIRYGRWPTRVRVRPGMLENIREYLFTAEDYARITAKVSLTPDGSLAIAEDDTGASYNYGEEGFANESPTPCAYEWFGVSPKPEA